MKLGRWLLLAASLAVACGGLIDELDPAVGHATKERCANSDSDLAANVSFAKDIVPLFFREQGAGCGCHLPSRADANPIGFEQTGLSLETYDSLRAGGVNSRSAIVVPGEPCSSLLWQKVSPGPPFGARMPFNGPPFLEPAERQLIADWIAEGARDN